MKFHLYVKYEASWSSLNSSAQIQLKCLTHSSFFILKTLLQASICCSVCLCWNMHEHSCTYKSILLVHPDLFSDSTEAVFPILLGCWLTLVVQSFALFFQCVCKTRKNSSHFLCLTTNNHIFHHLFETRNQRMTPFMLSRSGNEFNVLKPDPNQW